MSTATENRTYKKYAQQSKRFSNTPSYLMFLVCMMDEEMKEIALDSISHGGTEYFRKIIWKIWYNLNPNNPMVLGIPYEDMKVVNWEEVSKKISHFVN